MPLKTFHNLDASRKKVILNASYEEFAFNAYRTASVSNIVKTLGIAKGSFYRYFENKVDLYAFLLDNAYQLRMKQLDGLLENEELGFLELIRENFRNKIIFDLENPLESIFLFNAFQESNTPEIKLIIDDLKKEVLLFVSSLVVVFQKKREISRNVSPEVASQFIFQTQLGIYEYLSVFKGINFKESVQSGHLFPISENEIMEVVDEMLVIIESGLKKQ
jgi:AcrR family transcriptional regulator